MVALGTDFDGGFGVEAAPHEIETVADLVKIAPQLLKKGYKSGRRCPGSSAAIGFRILQENLPES